MEIRPSAATLSIEMTEEELSGLRERSQSENLIGRHLEIGPTAGSTLCLMVNCFETNARWEFTSCNRIWDLLWSPILQRDLSLEKQLKAKRNPRPV